MGAPPNRPLRKYAMWSAPAVLLVLLAGCTSCVDQLDVRYCTDRCGPTGEDVVIAWTAQHAAAWPRVDALMASVSPGAHLHEAWPDRASQDAFWTSVGIDPTAEQKQVFIQNGDASYRIRILRCA